MGLDRCQWKPALMNVGENWILLGTSEYRALLRADKYWAIPNFVACRWILGLDSVGKYRALYSTGEYQVLLSDLVLHSDGSVIKHQLLVPIN